MTMSIMQTAAIRKFYPSSSMSSHGVLKPKEYYQMLNNKIVGHDYAKRKLAVQLAMQRTSRNIKYGDNQPNTCMLLLGASGVGKTYLMETAAQVGGLQLMSVNASQLTAEGYRGVNLSGIMGRLQKDCTAQNKAMNDGILFLDEWDKRIQSHNDESHYAVSLQNEMLHLMEGKPVEVDSENVMDSQPSFSVDTRGLMIVFAGTFLTPEHKSIIRKPIGFEGQAYSHDSAKDDELLRQRLFDGGMLPEFYNRLSTIISLHPPEKEDLLKILIKPGGPLAACNQRMKASGLQLFLTKEAAESLVDYAHRSHLYARGLKRILDAAMNDLVFSGTCGNVLLDTRDIELLIAGRAVMLNDTEIPTITTGKSA